jgi:hypothetical protein
MDPDKQPDSGMLPSDLEAAWTDFAKLPVLEQTWPDAEALSALEALRRLEATHAERLERDAEFVRHFARLPIVAVAGLKNAGKSTLISTFLTPENRERIPRGLRTELGTQRFTLWLPARWERDAGLLQRLKSRLAGVFGHAAEALAADPAEAIRQQTQSDGMDRPLLAFDTALDEPGIALVDCPDIETVLGDTPEANARLRMLALTRDFCAGSIVVLSRDKLAVSTAKTILPHLPQATQIFAINSVCDELPNKVASEFTSLLGHRPQFIYLAFRFSEEGYAARTPHCDPSRKLPVADRIPFFFEVDPAAENYLPEVAGAESSILRLAERLPPETLCQQSQQETLVDFARECAAALDRVEGATTSASKEIERAAVDLFKTMRGLRSEGGELKFKPDPEILDRMRESITRKAPGWLWPMIKFNQGVAGALRLGKKAGATLWRGVRLLFGASPEAQIGRIRQNLSAHEMSTDVVTEALASWATRQGWTGDDARWQADAEEILRRFNNEERTNLSAVEWDELTKKFWDKAPKGKAAFTIGTTLVIGLAIAAWLAVEPIGGGLAAKLLAGKALLGVTVGEFLGSIGLGALVGTVAGQVLMRGIETKIASQQLSNLFAISADRLGVPRDLPAEFAKEFPAPSIVPKPHRDAYGVRERHWHLARSIAANLARLRITLNRLLP